MNISDMLEGKTAIVTGGTRGIGFGIVSKFLEAGANVALFGSRQETVDKALEKIREEKPDASVMGLYPSLENFEEANKAIQTVNEAYGQIDILVNNAGISARDSLYNYNPDEFEKIMAFNGIKEENKAVQKKVEFEEVRGKEGIKKAGIAIPA